MKTQSYKIVSLTPVATSTWVVVTDRHEVPERYREVVPDRSYQESTVHQVIALALVDCTCVVEAGDVDSLKAGRSVGELVTYRHIYPVYCDELFCGNGELAGLPVRCYGDDDDDDAEPVEWYEWYTFTDRTELDRFITWTNARSREVKRQMEKYDRTHPKSEGR